MPETRVILWTFENSAGDYLFPQTSLNQVFLNENNPTTRIAQSGIIKRAYVPHDITPIVGRFTNGTIPDPDEYQLEEKYYNLDTNRVHTVKANNTGTTASETLLAISSTAPSACSTGDKYFNSYSSRIYTATGTDTWGTEGAIPSTTTYYTSLDTNKGYKWDGAYMLISQRWTDGTVLEEDRIVVDTTNHHAYHYHGGILQDITKSSEDMEFEAD